MLTLFPRHTVVACSPCCCAPGRVAVAFVGMRAEMAEKRLTVLERFKQLNKDSKPIIEIFQNQDVLQQIEDKIHHPCVAPPLPPLFFFFYLPHLLLLLLLPPACLLALGG